METRGSLTPPALETSLLREEDREEHDPFSQSRAENRLNQDGRCRAGIASHGFGCLESDHPHCESGADRSKANVYVTGYFGECRYVHGFCLFGLGHTQPRRLATVSCVKLVC